MKLERERTREPRIIISCCKRRNGGRQQVPPVYNQGTAHSDKIGGRKGWGESRTGEDGMDGSNIHQAR